MGEESGSSEGAAIEAAVELMKTDRSPASVKGALVERGLSEERAAVVFEELRRLQEDQALAELDADLKKENAPPSMATHKKTTDRRSGFLMMLAGFFLLCAALRPIFLHSDWAPRAQPRLDDVPKLLLAAMGAIVMTAGLLKRRGWF